MSDDENKDNELNPTARWPHPIGLRSRNAQPPTEKRSEERLEELRTALRHEFDRRMYIASGVLDGVHEIKTKMAEVAKEENSRLLRRSGGEFKPYINVGVVAIGLGALGHYQSQFFYYLGFVFVALSLLLLMAEQGSVLVNQQRVGANNDAANNRISELRYTWVSNGFRPEDFDSLENRYHAFVGARLSEDERNEYEGWLDVGRRDLLNHLRSLSNLPEHPDLPSF